MSDVRTTGERDHATISVFRWVSHAARYTARHAVHSHPVPTAGVGECARPAG
jgi:hypothetical protein